MITKAALVLVLVGVAALAAPSDLYVPPSHQPGYKQEGMPYSFQYDVKDEYAGTDFGHNEESDGNAVTGSYTVQLPDGRRQTVTYVADHYNGYQAEVTYEGEAQYSHEYGPPVTFKPQYQDSYQTRPSYQPKPSYPPPSYQPKPSYPPPPYQPKPSYPPRPSYH